MSLTQSHEAKAIPLSMGLPNLPEVRVVNFFGYPVVVPKGYKWVAIDAGGEIYAYTRRPLLSDGADPYWHSNGRTSINVGSLDYDDNPLSRADVHASLVKVKKLPRYYP